MLRARVTTPLLLAALMLPLAALVPSSGRADDYGYGNGGYGDHGGDDDDWQNGQSAATAYSADLGRIAAAATGITTFRFGPDGTVTTLSGSGARLTGGSVRFQVSIPCSNGTCTNKETQVEIGSTGTPSGRLGALTNFTVSMGTARLASGPTGTNPIRFSLEPIGSHSTATFYVGADAPVYGSDSSKPTGPANSQIYVTTRDWKGRNAATTGAALTASVFRGLSVFEVTPLHFGTLVKPSAGLGVVILPASTGSILVFGTTALSSDPATRDQFTVTGEGGQVVSISVPTGFSMSNGSASIPVLLSREGDGNQTLSNSPGTAGTFNVYVGGAFVISNATASGVYSGTYTVNVDYN